MLILTRSNQEKLIIGKHGEIEIKILSINGNHYSGQVKIGITAPEDVPVDREEIFLKKQDAIVKNRIEEIYSQN